MPRKTHPESTPNHDRGYLRQQRNRVIKKNMIKSKREIHPDAVVVNLDQQQDIAEIIDTETAGPVVALHPHEIQEKSTDSKNKLLWPFNQPRGRFAGHIFDRAHSGHKPDNRHVKPGWRMKDKQAWRSEIKEDLIDE